MKSVTEFNRRIAEKITAAVSTMWCAYIFAAIALISLPAAIRTGDSLVIVAWVAQTFLQLVLLSIIMVGQQAQADSVAQKINETHVASLGEFELAKEARSIADQELAELKEITRDIHRVLKDIEGKK
ncbi:hypothetical protein MCEMRE182_00493 [Candidatus Nanopelagicaceae bacterium]